MFIVLYPKMIICCITFMQLHTVFSNTCHPQHSLKTKYQVSHTTGKFKYSFPAFRKQKGLPSILNWIWTTVTISTLSLSEVGPEIIQLYLAFMKDRHKPMFSVIINKYEPHDKLIKFHRTHISCCSYSS